MIEGGGKSLYKFLFVLVVLIFIGSIAFFIALRFSQKSRDSGSPSNENDNQNSNYSVSNDNSNSANDNTNSGDQVAAQGFYDAGIKLFNSKNYSGAIDQFAKAIEQYSKNPEYYSKKSQAENNLGQTKVAIDTINQGLVKNPDSDLLKTRLDILQKQWLGSQQQ